MGISYIYRFYFYAIIFYIFEFMEENNNPQEDDQTISIIYNLIIHYQDFMYNCFYVIIMKYFKIYDIYLYHYLLN